MDHSESKLVIIIDNNVSNGIYLSACARFAIPDSRVVWLSVNDEASPMLKSSPTETEHHTLHSLAEAAAFIDREAAQSSNIIIFYNLQLGSFQSSVAKAIDSDVTMSLKELVKNRYSILVNVHSTELMTRQVAEAIDPTFKTNPLEAKVICHHLITGASPRTIMDIVRATHEEWEERNMEGAR
jgi:hypothetical protein